jgi:hypothetical protein
VSAIEAAARFEAQIAGQTAPRARFRPLGGSGARGEGPCARYPPEIDYLLGSHVGVKAQEAFLGDIAAGAFEVEWGRPDDLKKAHALHRKYRGIRLGLVDGVVISIAERLRAAVQRHTARTQFELAAARGAS